MAAVHGSRFRGVGGLNREGPGCEDRDRSQRPQSTSQASLPLRLSIHPHCLPSGWSWVCAVVTLTSFSLDAADPLSEPSSVHLHSFFTYSSGGPLLHHAHSRFHFMIGKY